MSATLNILRSAVANTAPRFSVVPGSGLTAFDKRNRVVSVEVPDSADDALSRIIHAHELMHSRFSVVGDNAPGAGTLALQIAEDCIIHAACSYAVEHGRMSGFAHLWVDCLTVATADVRSSTAALRASPAISRASIGARAMLLRAAFLPHLASGRVSSFNAIGQRQMNRFGSLAERACRKHLCNVDPEWSRFVFSVNEVARMLNSVCWMKRRPKRNTYLVRAIIEHREEAHSACAALIGMTSTPQGKSRPVKPGEPGSVGDGVHWMRPPLVSACAPPLAGMRRVAASTGSRIRTHRLAAVATGSELRPFVRRVRKPEVACVVLDLSGSMGWTDDSLRRLCAALPSSSVFGYCDHCPRGQRVEGTIIRLAERGKRVDRIPVLSGGNGCDLQAVELARSFTQSGKRAVFVSDLGFCGQGPVKALRAETILKREARIQVVKSRDEALRMFNA